MEIAVLIIAAAVVGYLSRQPEIWRLADRTEQDRLYAENKELRERLYFKQGLPSELRKERPKPVEIEPPPDIFADRQRAFAQEKMQ